MGKEELYADVIRCYRDLREAIIDASKHPGDEFYAMTEMHASNEYDDALERLFIAREKDRRLMEEGEELPF
jgi:hypothetical protein